jgi:hypothetical protein
MKRNSKITNLDSLEKEIYRLKLESKMTEARLDKNIDFLKHNYATMFFSTILSKNTSLGVNGFKHTLFKNENLNTLFSSLADHIAEHATVSLKEKIEKLLAKR